MNSAAILWIVAIGLFSALAQYTLKVALNGVTAEPANSTYDLAVRALSSPQLMLAVALYIFVFGLYTIILAKMDVSQAFPTTLGANILFITIMSVVFLSETVTLPRIAGIALITAGIYLVARS
jgi:multidrug transporter EmrE-like cation transporter